MNLKKLIADKCHQFAEEIRRAVLRGMVEGLEAIAPKASMLRTKLPLSKIQLSPEETEQRPLYQAAYETTDTEGRRVSYTLVQEDGRYHLTLSDGRRSSSKRRRDVLRQARRWGLEIA